MNFKITALAALCLFTAVSASAQYMCTKQGTVFTRKTTSTKENLTSDAVITVESVNTAADGVITARYRTVEKVPGNEFAQLTSFSTYTFNPADTLTVYTVMDGEDFKNLMVNMIVEAAASQGQAVSDADKAELEKNISVKGSLTMDLPATINPAAKVKNRNMKLNFGPTTSTMSLWDFKYIGYESVETPAGNFSDCLKVSYVMKTNSPEGTEKQYCTTWFAKGVGEVKTITTDKKGNVEEEQVLMSVSEQ